MGNVLRVLKRDVLRLLKTPPALVVVLALLVLLCGIGRMGASNTVYVTLRQAVAIGHATLAVGWFYLRATPRRRARRTPQPIPNSEA